MPALDAWLNSFSLLVYCAAILAICLLMILVSSVIGGRNWGRAKNDPFESGVVSQGSARLRLSAQFYRVAILFVIFEVETLFLFAWAVSVREVGWAGFAVAAVFMVILFVGLAYEAGVGALDWSPAGRRKRAARAQQPKGAAL